MVPIEISGVIFDLGSTLIDFEGNYDHLFLVGLEAISDSLRDQAIEIDGQDFIHSFGEALRQYHRRRDDDHVELSSYTILCQVLHELVDPLPEEQVLRDGLSAMYAVSEAYWTPKPAAHTVLKTLSGAGYQLGILSNAGDEANVQRLIDMAGIREYFDPILISAALGIRKPDPRPFHQIREQWGLPAQAIVMVGDLLEADILGAQNAGMHSIWLPDPNLPDASQHTHAPHPTLVASDLSQVPDLLKSIAEKG